MRRSKRHTLRLRRAVIPTGLCNTAVAAERSGSTTQPRKAVLHSGATSRFSQNDSACRTGRNTSRPHRRRWARSPYHRASGGSERTCQPSDRPHRLRPSGRKRCAVHLPAAVILERYSTHTYNLHFVHTIILTFFLTCWKAFTLAGLHIPDAFYRRFTRTSCSE